MPVDLGSERRGGEPRRRLEGLQLSTKIMLTFTGVATLALGILGVVLALTTSGFLFDQTRHQGIELAKMTAQVGRAVIDSLPEDEPVDSDVIKARIERYLNDARRWGDEPPGTYSFVHGIVFQNGPLSAMGVGQVPNRDARAPRKETVFDIPGSKEVQLKDFRDIDAYSIDSNVDGVKTPVYRFKVNLNERAGPGYSDQRVWVDVGIATIQRVRTKLYLLILLGVLVITLSVMLAARFVAGRITRPLRLLMRDMQVVAKGDLGHRTKARSSDEIGVLATEFDHMTQQLQVAQEAVIEREKAAYELSIAREVQQQLLPAEAPAVPGYDAGAFYRGAQAVSGDYYDFIPLDDHRMGFVVADVSGKGVPGSMVMAITRTLVRLVAGKHGSDAAETLQETNRLIAKEIRRGMFVTALYAVLDTRTGELTFASAGHNPLAIYRRDSGKVELLAPRGIAIGFNAGPIFDRAIQQFSTLLMPGDVFVMYTDGFPEARNEQEVEFGDERFFQSIAECADGSAAGLIRGLVGRINRYRGRAPQSDDLTMVAVRRLG